MPIVDCCQTQCSFTLITILTLSTAADAVAEDSVEVAAVAVEAAAAVAVSEDETRKLSEWTQIKHSSIFFTVTRTDCSLIELLS